MKLDKITPNVTGWSVIPDLNAIRKECKARLGQQAGNTAADSLRVDGWKVAHDMRLDGLSDGFVCERKNPDGSVASVCWTASMIRSMYPPVKP
jgi:hypothetical protein